jgi:SpoVK/Ycf46/Vps4 family AAA+-type ATPase
VDLWAKALLNAVGLNAASPDGAKAPLKTVALFDGPGGTGKTLAAHWLAAALGGEVQRVDLSRVVSQYIGETEKNIDALFRRAESAGAVLLFDEADALFGKRSEVKDSHERYANIEVSHLLQRIEQYPGVTLLASNASAAIDPDALRRVQAVVRFPIPLPDPPPLAKA